MGSQIFPARFGLSVSSPLAPIRVVYWYTGTRGSTGRRRAASSAIWSGIENYIQGQCTAPRIPASIESSILFERSKIGPSNIMKSILDRDCPHMQRAWFSSDTEPENGMLERPPRLQLGNSGAGSWERIRKETREPDLVIWAQLRRSWAGRKRRARSSNQRRRALAAPGQIQGNLEFRSYKRD